MPNQKRPGARVLPKKEVSYNDYVADGTKYVTRSEMDWVQRRAFRANAKMLETLINDFEKHQDRKVWYRRLVAWLKSLGGTPKEMTIADLPPAAREDLKRQLAAADGEEAEGTEEAIEVEDPRAVRRTCVNCGSANLGPVNELGGVKCNKCGAVLDDPPEGPNIAGHIGGPLGPDEASDPIKE